MTVKTCSKCNKPGSFYKDKNATGGFRAICKTCDKAKASNWNKRNADKHADHEKNYRQSNVHQMKVNKKKYYENNPRSVKNSALKYNYGLSIEQFDLMKAEQDNSCKICKRKESELDRPLCVDHSHATGKVRNLLCAHCNSALGLIREDIKTVKSMLSYLELHSE